MNSPKILAVVDNVHMGLGHQGLSLVANKLGVNLDKINENSLVLFLNRAKDKLKVLGPGGVVMGYIRMPKGRKIPLDAIQWLPKTFASSGRIDINKAIQMSVVKSMERREASRTMELYR